MSIRQSIEEAIAGGRLFVFEPEFDGDELVRSLLLHPQLAADISERVEEWGKRVGRLQADFESFVKGEHISLSMTPFEHKAATMGLMEPTADGTWKSEAAIPNLAYGSLENLRMQTRSWPSVGSRDRLDLGENIR